jgi:hypothetical protein
VLRADPACRRVVFASDAAALDRIAAAEAAGYRYVVDVDVEADEQLSLLVTEPGHLTQEPLDVGDMPGT